MAEQVNEWKDEMHYIFDDKGNDSNVYKYILQSKCHSINDFKEQMNEKNLQNAFNRFNWLQSHRFWRKRNVCVSVCLFVSMNEEKNSAQKQWATPVFMSIFMIDAFQLVWIYHNLWHIGCMHFKLISLLEMFQIVLINYMFALSTYK